MHLESNMVSAHIDLKLIYSIEKENNITGNTETISLKNHKSIIENINNNIANENEHGINKSENKMIILKSDNSSNLESLYKSLKKESPEKQNINSISHVESSSKVAKEQENSFIKQKKNKIPMIINENKSPVKSKDKILNLLETVNNNLFINPHESETVSLRNFPENILSPIAENKKNNIDYNNNGKSNTAHKNIASNAISNNNIYTVIVDETLDKNNQVNIDSVHVNNTKTNNKKNKKSKKTKAKNSKNLENTTLEESIQAEIPLVLEEEKEQKTKKGKKFIKVLLFVLCS